MRVTNKKNRRGEIKEESRLEAWYFYFKWGDQNKSFC